MGTVIFTRSSNPNPLPIDTIRQKYGSKAIALSDNSPVIVSWLAVTCYENEEIERSEKLIESLIQRIENEYVPPMGIYFYYLIKGDMDMAFDWLERAI